MKKLATFIVRYVLLPTIFIILYIVLPLLLIHQCISNKPIRGIAAVLYMGLGFPLLLVATSYLSERRRKFGNRLFPDWLRVMSEKAWDPDWTYVESNFEPVVHKTARESGQTVWQIEFVCPELYRQIQTRKESAWRSFWKWRVQPVVNLMPRRPRKSRQPPKNR